MEQLCSAMYIIETILIAIFNLVSIILQLEQWPLTSLLIITFVFKAFPRILHLCAEHTEVINSSIKIVMAKFRRNSSLNIARKCSIYSMRIIQYSAYRLRTSAYCIFLYYTSIINNNNNWDQYILNWELCCPNNRHSIKLGFIPSFSQYCLYAGK